MPGYPQKIGRAAPEDPAQRAPGDPGGEEPGADLPGPGPQHRAGQAAALDQPAGRRDSAGRQVGGPAPNTRNQENLLKMHSPIFFALHDLGVPKIIILVLDSAFAVFT